MAHSWRTSAQDPPINRNMAHSPGGGLMTPAGASAWRMGRRVPGGSGIGRVSVRHGALAGQASPPLDAAPSWRFTMPPPRQIGQADRQPAPGGAGIAWPMSAYGQPGGCLLGALAGSGDIDRQPKETPLDGGVRVR